MDVHSRGPSLIVRPCFEEHAPFQDNNSRYTFKDLRRLLKESDAIVYSIGIERANEGELGISGESILVDLASVSGGKAFFPTTAAEMDDVFERTALECHQYSIGYRPANFTSSGA